MTVSLTTVGYGFFVPTKTEDKMFVIIFMIIGVTLILSFCMTFANNVLLAAHDEAILRFLRWRGHGEPTDKEMRHYRSVLSILLVILWGFVGTLFYSGNEDWPLIDGLYWTVMTMTTVGYGECLNISRVCACILTTLFAYLYVCAGDLPIKFDSTRVFGIIFIYCSVLTFAVAFSNLSNDYTAGRERGELRRKLQTLSEEHFGETWADRLLRPRDGQRNIRGQITVRKDGEVGCSKERFILMALAELGVVSFESDVTPLAQVTCTCVGSCRDTVCESLINQF